MTPKRPLSPSPRRSPSLGRRHWLRRRTALGWEKGPPDLRGGFAGARGRAPLTIVVAAVGLVGLALAVNAGPLALDRADTTLAHLRSTQGGVLLDAFDWAGSLPIWFGLVCGLTALAVSRSSPPLGVQILVTALVAELSSALIKVVVGRTRPDGANLDELLITASFPSGHVTRAAVLTAAVLVLMPGGWPRAVTAVAGVVVVIIMSLARVSGRAHHMSDALAGALLGALIVALWALYRTRAVE